MIFNLYYVIFNTSYRRFLARRCCRFNGAAGAAGAGREGGGDAGAAGAAAGATGGNTGGGTVAGGGGIAGGALWPIDTHRARHKQSRSGTGRQPPRVPVP